MTHPYSADLAPRVLTEAGIDRYRWLNERDNEVLKELREKRDQHEKEIESLDDVMRDIEVTIARRQAKMRGDLIAASAAVDAFGGPQTGVIMPSALHPAESFPETKPDGYCIHCGKEAWRVSVSPASPKGARHGYGATCNPDDPTSGVAELDDFRGES